VSANSCSAEIRRPARLVASTLEQRTLGEKLGDQRRRRQQMLEVVEH
jgi:hypothetical protein